jgi:phthalate 4,5-dioxygenase oxygenase subunit
MPIEKDSEDLVRVGPGTVMGNMMREYWLPALASSEVKSDAAPVRLMLLSEKLICFRDSKGRLGVMDHRCPHRCASLFFGRNEESGIRCVYHGWKFDVDGNCVDMPNLPPSQDFKQKVKAKVYKARERNGLIWVYMGARAEPPELPMLEVNDVPDGQLQFYFVQRECNWLQALEGDIDTSHFGFLHAGSVMPEDVRDDDLLRFTVSNRAPEYRVADTGWGTAYGAYRNAGGGETYWRFANFLFPFWTQPPQGEFEDSIRARAWVPMDDTHTMFIHMQWAKRAPHLRTLKNGKMMPGVKALQYQPNTSDWYGRWRPTQTFENDYLIDRDAQKNGDIYTGIEVVYMQDQAVTESMGAITDHAFEHLAPSDQMIARVRRRLLRAARAFAEKGTVPPGVDDPDVYLKARGGEFLSASTDDWLAIYYQRLADAKPLSELVAGAE